MAHTGIIIINTGTPEALTEEAVRDFLGTMLSDPALISCPRIIWKRVLKYFILPKRPKKTLNSYVKMWDADGSVFMRVSNAQRDALEGELARRGIHVGTLQASADVEVRLAMRYSSPTIESQVAALKDAGCDTLVFLPLYPQYVRVCAGTCLTEARRSVEVLTDQAWQPRVVEIESFYVNPSYIEALAQSIRECWEYKPGSKLCLSFHSTPMKDINDGDPYRDQCNATGEALARALGISEEDWLVAYQSRYDSRAWLGPFTEDVLGAWARAGVKDVCMVCPGFVAENIESKIEAGEQLAACFLDAAGQGARYTYVPTLDAANGLIAALADAVQEVLQ